MQSPPVVVRITVITPAYACHEGKCGMFGILSGARAIEKKAAVTRLASKIGTRYHGRAHLSFGIVKLQ